MGTPFKMKGHTLPGPNQRVSPVKEVHGAGTDWEHEHKESVAHSDGAEVHNKPVEKPKKETPVKQKYDLSKATVDGKHPQTEKNKKYEGMDSKDLFLHGKTRDKDGNVKDIQWALPPNPPKD